MKANILKLSLATLRNKVCFPIRGNFLMVQGLHPCANIEIRIDDENSELLRMHEGDIYIGNFTKFYVSNGTYADIIATLIYSDESQPSKYFKSSRHKLICDDLTITELSTAVAATNYSGSLEASVRGFSFKAVSGNAQIRFGIALSSPVYLREGESWSEENITFIHTKSFLYQTDLAGGIITLTKRFFYNAIE